MAAVFGSIAIEVETTKRWYERDRNLHSYSRLLDTLLGANIATRS